MDYEGKVVRKIEIAEMKYLEDRARSVLIELADGTRISIRPCMGNSLIVSKSVSTL